MQNLSPVHWAALVGAVALIVWPRLPAIKEAAAGLLSRFWPATAEPAETVDADAVALTAFKTLRAKLGPELAAQVWAKIQPIEEAKP